MKRKDDHDHPKEQKKPRTRLKEVESVYDQAEQYRLVTAKFPIDALTPEWSMGKNRSIDEAHKRRLVQMFKDVGVLRRGASHRLRVACTKVQVQQMLDHLKQDRQQAQCVVGTSENAQEAGPEQPSFDDWSSVVGDKAELIAGNHRVEALKEYLRCSRASKAERWWVCDVYDKDALPPHLHIKLRANREDAVLPDNHGQIWTELATLSSTNNKLFQDSNKVVEQQMLEQLGLSGRVKFPVRRLATLWKNKHWNAMITRWCQFPVGQATFTISTFEWMASCRIDDFWFAAFDQVIEAVSQIRSELGFDVQATDWNKLAGLPQSRTREDVQDLFYPGLGSDAEPEILSTRRRDFVSGISPEKYHNLYEFILSKPARRFIDVQALLKTTKQEGKVMSIIMSHIGQWISKEPTKVVDRDNNKPALRKDLVPGLRERYGEEAEDKSKRLQQLLLDHVRNNAKELTSTTLEHYLHEYPSGNGDAYGTRFEHAVWRNLLNLVVDFAGPTLQHCCLVRFSSDGSNEIVSTPSPPTIAQTARDLICLIPEIAKNPALQTKSASDKLCTMIQPVIDQWVAERCAEALGNYGEEWQASTIELVEAERAKSKALLTDTRPSLPPPSSPASTLSPALLGDADERLQIPSTHGSSQEHGTSKTRIDQLIPVTTPLSVVLGPRESIDMTADDLHNLRKVHRSKMVAHPQKLQTRQKPPSLSIDNPIDEERPRVLPTIRGSHRWRKLGTAGKSSR